MRLFINFIIIVMIFGALAGGVMLYQQDVAATEALDSTQSALERFQEEIRRQSALAVMDGRQYPETVDPHWFSDGQAPVNALLGTKHPWVEVAPLEERELLHPPTKAAAKATVAQFWYNPRLGVIRARVPMAMSDAETLAAYNQVNGSKLTSLFELVRPSEDGADPSAAPARH